MTRMILGLVFIVIFSVTIVSAIPQIRDLKGSPLGNFEKQKQEDNKENNLPLAFSHSHYHDYDYDNYDYLEYWYDCHGDMCVNDIEYVDMERKVEVDNSSLELTESEYFDVNTTTLWEECAPSVPLTGRLVKFKSCRQWAEDNDGIFNSYYSNYVCNFRKRVWLGQNGDIDGGKIAEMFKELEGFEEYLDSCIQWNGEWPDHYHNHYYDYYDYDYRIENGDDDKGAKNDGNKRKSKNKGSKTKRKNNTEKKKKKRNKVGKKKKNNAKRTNGGKNGNAMNKKNKKRKTKRNNQLVKKWRNGKRGIGLKTNKPNNKPNVMRFKREAAKDKKGKKNNNKKKKKQKKQQKALKLIELTTLPTEQTVERLRCIEMSVSIKLDQCGENILKNVLPPKHIGK